jgi:hypothetical protein
LLLALASTVMLDFGPSPGPMTVYFFFPKIFTCLEMGSYFRREGVGLLLVTASPTGE